MSIETDKSVVRRGHTDQSKVGKALRRSLTFEMAETRLASANWFWSDEKQDFVHVAESKSGRKGSSP